MDKQNVPQVINYLPANERTPDTQYQDLLKRLLETGRKIKPIHNEHAFALVGQTLRFNMRNGFPILPVRDLSKAYKGSIGELVGFLNGARTLEEMVSFGCPRIFWERWVTPEKCAVFGLEAGDLGSASYGPSWRAMPSRDGTPFDQVANVIALAKRFPNTRTLRITPWYPPEILGPDGTRKVVVAPCHGDVHIHLYPETKEMALFHLQRSGDIPVGVQFNLIEYAALGMMLGRVLGYTFVEYVHTISDAHLYESQIEHVKEMIEREPRIFPTVTFTDDAPTDDIFAFRREHFVVADYNPHERMDIPTPI